MLETNKKNNSSKSSLFNDNMAIKKNKRKIKKHVVSII